MKFLRSLCDHLLEGVIAYNTDGDIVYFNPSAQKFLKTTDDLIHQQISTLFPADLLIKGNDSPAIPFQNGTLYFQALGDPSDPWPNSAARSLELPDGEKVYLLYFIFKSLQYNYKYPINFLEDLINLTPTAIFLKDAEDDMRIMLVNQSCAEYFGIPEKEIVGRFDKDLFPPEIAEQQYKDDLLCLKNKVPLSKCERVVDPRGNVRYFQTTKCCITNPDGARRILGISNDITSQSELYQNQIAYTKGLENFFILNDEKAVGNNTLKIICERVNATRVFAQTYIPAVERFCTARQYFPPDAPPFPEGLNIPLNPENSLFLKTLKEQGYVFIPDTSDLSDPVHKEIVSHFNPALGAKSLYFLRLHIEGLLSGYAVVSYEKAVHRLSSYEEKFLKDCIYFLNIGLEQLKSKKWFEQREKTMNMLIMNTPVPLAVWDNEGRFLLCNQAYCDCIQLTVEELIEKDIHCENNCFSEGIKPLTSSNIYPVTEVLHGQKRASAPWKIKDKDWVFLAQGAYDKDGHLEKIFESAIDVTSKNQKIAQQKAINMCMEEIFLKGKTASETLNSVIDLIVKYFHSDIGYLKKFNEDSSEIIAKAGNEEHLQDVMRLQKEISPQFTEELIKRMNREKLVLINITGPLLKQFPYWKNIFNPQIKTILVTGLHIQGKLWGYITLALKEEKEHILKDDMDIFYTFQYALEIILDRNKLLANLEQERDNALAAEKAKSFFFATVSHDIRTPLNAIIGLSELLKLGVDSQEIQNQYLESIIMSGQTLKQLINDVLDLAKLEAGKMLIKREMTDCSKIIDGLSLAFASETQQRDITLNCKAEGLPLLNIDPQRIRQILFNLIGNACKFTQQGSITVDARFEKTSPTQGNLMISVKDTGIGISKENLGKLMMPYVQVSSKSSEGTGLGLSICKHLLKRMNGEMFIQSELGKGSDFSIIVRDVEYKYSKENVSEPVENHDSRSILKVKDLNILMVDDVKLNLMVLSAMCKRLGVEKMTSALSGQEALRLLDEGSFNLILTDLWMPGMDGRELTKRIHEDKRFKSLPIYVVTADVEVQKTYSQMGFDGVLLKPITIDQFSALLRDINQKRNGNR